MKSRKIWNLFVMMCCFMMEFLGEFCQRKRSHRAISGHTTTEDILIWRKFTRKRDFRNLIEWIFLFCFYSTFSPRKRSDDDRAEKYITNLRERNKFCKCLFFLGNLEQELKSVFLCQNYATSEINKKKLCMLLARM